MLSIRWVIFLAGTAALVWFTWSFSVRERRYHGVARFFAFEAILALTLLNIGFWFTDALSPRQLLSWVLLCGSTWLPIHGFRLLKRVGRPDGQIENTTALVEQGAYRYIRHPLYASVMALTLGIWLKDVTGLTTMLAAVGVLAVYATARIEEGELVAKFGDPYAAYMRRTKMFIPWIW